VKPNRRTQALIVALAGTLAAVAWVSGNDDEVSAPATRDRTGAVRTQGEAKAGPGTPELRLAALETRGLDDMKTDLFASKSWYVPPPPPPPQPPPKPTAPPLPFAYLGRMIDGGSTVVFVSSQDHNRILRVGDVVDRVWRVDAIEGSRMQFTYLPLNENKYLILGAAP
jgi:hypothetical protein